MQDTMMTPQETTALPEEDLQTPNPETIEQPEQTPEDHYQARLEQLAAREKALEQRERHIKAKGRLSELGLPGSLLNHLDLSSDEALEQTLALAGKAASLAIGAPRAATPPIPPFATYLERARLFEEDPAAYALLREQNDLN